MRRGKDIIHQQEHQPIGLIWQNICPSLGLPSFFTFPFTFWGFPIRCDHFGQQPGQKQMYIRTNLHALLLLRSDQLPTLSCASGLSHPFLRFLHFRASRCIARHQRPSTLMIWCDSKDYWSSAFQGACTSVLGVVRDANFCHHHRTHQCPKFL